MRRWQESKKLIGSIQTCSPWREPLAFQQRIQPQGSLSSPDVALLPSFLHIGYIGIPSTANGICKVAEHAFATSCHRLLYLPINPLCPKYGVPVQFSNIRDSAGPDRVQVNIASRVLKIGILPADNGFISILKRDVVQNTRRVKTSKYRHALAYCTKRRPSQFTLLPASSYVLRSGDGQNMLVRMR